MSSSSKTSGQSSLFQVYLRLRPSYPNHNSKATNPDQWLVVESPSSGSPVPQDLQHSPEPTHITLQPPNDSRKRAIERFGFTRVFPQDATQLEVFESTGTIHLVRNILENGRDGLLATLGVTGSGKVQTEETSNSTI